MAKSHKRPSGTGWDFVTDTGRKDASLSSAYVLRGMLLSRVSDCFTRWAQKGTSVSQ